MRILGATNADLSGLVRRGRFKQDLLDRLAFEVLTLPPLRDRHGDLPLLVDHFAGRMAFELGWREAPRFSERAMAILAGHDWPGNVRELKNVVERAVYRSDAALIREIDLDPFRTLGPGRQGAAAGETAPSTSSLAPVDTGSRSLKKAVRELERRMLREALAATRYSQKDAAAYLGLTYDQFRGLKRKHGDQL